MISISSSRSMLYHTNIVQLCQRLDTKYYKAPYVSPQASSEPSCCYTCDLYLVSLFSNGNRHHIWPRSPFASIRYRASDLPVNHLVASGRSVCWTRLCNPPLDCVQPNTASDFLVSRLMCVSRRFLWGAPRASRPRVHGSHCRPCLDAFEMSHVMREMHEVARTS